MTLQAIVRQLAKHKQEVKDAPELPTDIRTLTGYKPRPLQQKLEDEAKRFNVDVLHRRFGKTTMWLNLLLEAAIHCPFPRGRYAYLAPTYGMAEDIAWAILKDLTEKIPGREVRESRLAVLLPTYYGDWSRIRLYGVDSPKQRLRGLYLDGVVLDEFPEFPPSVWTEQVRPMLADAERFGWDARGWRNQWATFVGTPKGRNMFHRFYTQAAVWSRGEPIKVRDPLTGKDEMIHRDDWRAALHKASETGVLTKMELQSALIDMGSRAKYEQEFECSFDAAVEGAIFAEVVEAIRQRGQIRAIPYNPASPVHTGWDLGHDDNTSIWFVQMHGMIPVLIDYYEARQIGDLGHYADVLEARGYRYGKHFFPHDVEHTFLGMAKSRRQILGELGIRVSLVPKHAPSDRIAAVRRFLGGAYINEPKCIEGIDHLSLYRRKKNEAMGVVTDMVHKDEHTDAADALGCLVMGLTHATRLGDEQDDPNRQAIAELG